MNACQQKLAGQISSTSHATGWHWSRTGCFCHAFSKRAFARNTLSKERVHTSASNGADWKAARSAHPVCICLSQALSVEAGVLFYRSISNTNQTAHWSRSEATGSARDAKSEQSRVNPVCNTPPVSPPGVQDTALALPESL